MDVDPKLVASLRTVLAQHPEIRLTLLFGSRARGVAGTKADLDLAVELPQGEEPDRLGLMAELSSATGLGVDVVDVTPGRRVGYPLPSLPVEPKDDVGINLRASCNNPFDSYTVCFQSK